MCDGQNWLHSYGGLTRRIQQERHLILPKKRRGKKELNCYFNTQMRADFVSIESHSNVHNRSNSLRSFLLMHFIGFLHILSLYYVGCPPDDIFRACEEYLISFIRTSHLSEQIDDNIPCRISIEWECTWRCVANKLPFSEQRRVRIESTHLIAVIYLMICIVSSSFFSSQRVNSHPHFRSHMKPRKGERREPEFNFRKTTKRRPTIWHILMFAHVFRREKWKESQSII